MTKGNDQNAFPITDTALRWLEIILTKRFDHKWHLSRVDAGLCLHLVGAEGSIFYDTLCEGFTQPHSDQPCTYWDAEFEGWLSVLGESLPAPGVPELLSPLIEQLGSGQVIHYDILGLVYWMLARVEEIGRTDLDEHERFPAYSSHALKHGYLDRPVVDEWLHLLGQVIQRQWPGIVLKKQQARTFVTCDVDTPFDYVGKLTKLPRRVFGDLFKRKSIKSAFLTIAGNFLSHFENFRLDGYYQGLLFILEENEKLGQRVNFYFIPEKTHNDFDQPVSLYDTRLRNLLKMIHLRGHHIGIHPGYSTSSSPNLFAKSVSTLRKVLNELGIDLEDFECRQHYLKFQIPSTPRLWKNNGITSDTSIGYADHPGFRCGTCFEYPLFDAVEQQQFGVREKPLILMECSVISDRYLGLGYTESALEMMKYYKDTCHTVGGIFTLLWHNSHLTTEMDRRFYRELIK